jgi:hypothetical protein
MKMLDASHGALVYPVGAEVPAADFASRGPVTRPWRVEVLFVDAQKVAAITGHSMSRCS